MKTLIGYGQQKLRFHTVMHTCSAHLIENQESVDIHVDDHNASDHYAISVSLKTESTNMEKDKLCKYKTLKYMWIVE